MRTARSSRKNSGSKVDFGAVIAHEGIDNLLVSAAHRLHASNTLSFASLEKPHSSMLHVATESLHPLHWHRSRKATRRVSRLGFSVRFGSPRNTGRNACAASTTTKKLILNRRPSATRHSAGGATPSKTPGTSDTALRSDHRDKAFAAFHCAAAYRARETRTQDEALDEDGSRRLRVKGRNFCPSRSVGQK